MGFIGLGVRKIIVVVSFQSPPLISELLLLSFPMDIDHIKPR